MPFFVYVLESESTGRRYIGQTDDLARRVAEHNDPAHNTHKYTTKHLGPWKLVHQEVFDSRSEATRRERALKSGQGRQWLDQELR